MRAVAYKKALPISNEESLIDIVTENPVVSGRDICVRVEAVSVNPVDTKIRRGVSSSNGEYKIIGWDAAGVVESVGDEVTLFAPGDRVWYAGEITRPGSNAEFQCVDERIVSKMPESLSFEQAAALPLTSITAWEILFERFKLTEQSEGELLIIGGAGGVGSMMIQLAKALTNMTVIVTASRPETIQWVNELGADSVINHRKSISAQLEAIGFPTVSHIASLTHTDEHLEEIVKSISPQGDLAVIDDPATLDIMPFKSKSISIHWELMYTRSLYKTEDMIEQHRLLSRVAELVDQGTVRSTLVESFGYINADNLKRAHTVIESGKSIGKIVLAKFTTEEN